MLTIVSILAAVAAPSFVSMSSYRLRRAAHELAMHVETARDLAIATQRHTWVVFDTGAETYSVYIENPSNPGRANRIPATHPVTGGAFTVALNSGDFAGIVMDSASFGSGSEVEFDWSGVPYDGNAQALAADGTVVLGGSGTRTVSVACQTGYVQEE